MRKKDYRSGAERLNDIMSVCEDMKFTEVEASEVIDALAAVRADVFLYVQNWACKEDKGCEIHITFPGIDFDFPIPLQSFSINHPNLELDSYGWFYRLLYQSIESMPAKQSNIR